MVRINYKGSNIGDGNFEEVEIQDNSEQVAKRNERYIEDLKTNRDAQTQIESNFIRESEAALRRGAASEKEERSRQIAAARSIAQQQQKQLAAQAREVESITGRASNVTGRDSSDVDNWIEFVTNTSDKARTMYEEHEQKKADFSWEQGIAKQHMFGANWDNVAWNRRWNDDGIIGASKDELAAMAEASGADPSYVDELRNGNTHFIKATKHALATDMLSQSTAVFQQQLQSDAKTIIDVNINGEMKKVPLNEIDRGDPNQLTQAYYQWLPKHIKEQGFGDASPEFLTDGLIKAKSGYDTMMGNVRQNQITRTKQERVDGSIKVLQAQQNPISAKGYHSTLMNNDPKLTGNAAWGMVIEQFGDPTTFKNEAQIDYILDNTIVQGGKTLREMYLKDVEKMQEARLAYKENDIQKKTRQRTLNEKTEIEAIKAGVIQDRLNGGGVDEITNEQIDEKIAEATREGKPLVAQEWELVKTQTADTAREEELVAGWDERLTAGQMVQPSEVVTSGVSAEAQAKYLKLANKSLVESIPKEDLEQFNAFAKAELRNKAEQNYTKDSIVDGTVLLAENRAEADFKKDYLQAMRDPSMGTPAKALQYAQGRFNERIKNEEGIYKLTDVKPGGRPYGYFTPKGVAPADDFQAELHEQIQSQGGMAFAMPHKALEVPIQKTLETYERTGMFNYPPAIKKMSQMSGGKFTELQILQMQSESLNIPLPEGFQQAKEIETSIGPSYHKYIAYRNNPTRTDVAVMSTGEDPIYEQLPAIGRRVMDSVSKRESPVAGYEAVNRGQGGDSPGGAINLLGKNLSDMTINEAIRAQQQGRVHAVGRYQFIGNTLPEAMQDAGFTGNEKLTPVVQDALFWAHFDKYGISKWEPYWGNPATMDEMRMYEQFRDQYDYQKPVWRQSKNMNPALVYTTGNIGPTSTGEHLDVKQVGGGRFNYKALDQYVYVMDPEFGKISLGDLREKTNFVGDSYDQHTARGSHGIDYGTASGTQVFLQNGAKFISSRPSEHGDVVTIKLPNGKQYTFLHGKAA